LGDRADRLQPPVGVEDVVFGVVNGEGIRVVGSAFGGARAAFLEACSCAEIEAPQGFLELSDRK